MASPPKRESPTAGPLLEGGLTQTGFMVDFIYTLVESDLSSYTVSGLETSLNQDIWLRVMSVDQGVYVTIDTMHGPLLKKFLVL